MFAIVGFICYVILTLALFLAGGVLLWARVRLGSARSDAYVGFALLLGGLLMLYVTCTNLPFKIVMVG